MASSRAKSASPRSAATTSAYAVTRRPSVPRRCGPARRGPSRPRGRSGSSPGRAWRAGRRPRARRARRAAIVSAEGESRRPSKRRPNAAVMRRWIAIARGMSISCSVIDHISVSHGCGLRRTRSAGSRADRAPDHRVVAEARVEVGEVVVDPGREAHPRDPLARGGLRRRPRREHGPGPATTTGCAADVQEPHEPGPAPPREPAERRPSRNGAQRGSTTSRTSTKPARSTVSRGAAGGRRPGRSATT